jgi:putative oxidoreductase
MNALKLKFLGKFNYIGLLLLRLGLGVSFVLHGTPKIFGGPALWQQLGGAMNFLGISSFPAFWGFMAAFAEFGGGILILLGFLFRPAALLLAFTMAVATIMHVKTGDEFKVYSHAMELFIVFVGLMFVGPGKLSIDGE